MNLVTFGAWWPSIRMKWCLYDMLSNEILVQLYRRMKRYSFAKAVSLQVSLGSKIKVNVIHDMSIIKREIYCCLLLIR